MSETKSKPLTFKGILTLVAAGVLYLVSQLLGIDLTGKGSKDSQTGGGTEVQQPADPSEGSGEAPKKKYTPPPAKETTKPAPPKEDPKAEASKRDDAGKIQKLFRAMRSDVQVEAEGTIVHLLPDDNQGSRHQLFLMDLSNGLTLKISHNIDIAPYVPVKKGDTIRFYGEYEYNKKGGVVHWTHRNTRGGSHPGGWLLHKGKKYE